MFKEEREEYMFDWNMIGDIGEGRPNLGKTMDVVVTSVLQTAAGRMIFTRLKEAT